MAIDVKHTLRLPACWAGAAFTTPAVTQAWRGVQDRALDALHALSSTHDRDAAAWFCSVGAPDGPRLGALFVSDTEPTPAHRETLQEALGSSWEGAGQRALPRRAFPGLAVILGTPYALWTRGVTDLRSGRLVLHEGELLPTRILARDAELRDFPVGALHAQVAPVGAEIDGAPRIEVLKVVFAMNVCERMAEADGELVAEELDFLQRAFPPERLRELGLHDRLRFLALRHVAGPELARALSDDEKLGLMGLFYRAGHADGVLDEAELRILREAADQLQLAPEEVDAYLEHIW